MRINASTSSPLQLMTTGKIVYIRSATGDGQISSFSFLVLMATCLLLKRMETSSKAVLQRMLMTIARADKIGSSEWADFEFLFFDNDGDLYAVPKDGSLLKSIDSRVTGIGNFC